MASIKKFGAGWRAQVAMADVRQSKNFSTKAEAAAWAVKRESEIRPGSAQHPAARKTLDEALERYLSEVSVHKRGHRMERHRLTAIAGQVVAGKRLGDMVLASVIRELNLLSHVFMTARREWGGMVKSPTTDVRRPKGSEPRDRRISSEEIERICAALGFDEAPVNSKSGAIAVAFLYALETAMRAGEICSLKRSEVKGRRTTTTLRRSYRRSCSELTSGYMR